MESGSGIGTMTNHRLDPERIAPRLKTARIGRRLLLLDEVDSTNEYALGVLAPREGLAADGMVVFAEHQTAGRGRLGRTWHSPRGASLAMTVLLCESQLPPSPVRLVMAGGVAVAKAVASTTDVEPVIRWPNDVYVGPKKLAGILVEARSVGTVSWAMAVGIGLNCLQQAGHFPPELRDRATSLELESKHAIDREAVAVAVMNELDVLVRRDSSVSDAALVDQWRARSADLGTRVTLRENGQTYSGIILDVHPQSGLLLQLDTGARRHFDPATTSREVLTAD